MTSLPILIAGAGIGGLSLALGLAERGMRVLVLERAPTLGEIGAGIQLGPNAFHSFDFLGIAQEAKRHAIFIDSLRLMDALSGDEIIRIPLEDAFRQRFGNPYAVVHRGELHSILLRRCRESSLVDIRTSAEVARYDQDGASVTATLADGERLRGSALVGADGLWSNVRSQLAADGPPRVSGHTTYRSVIAVEDMPEDLRWNAATLWAGPKCHIVHYPLSDWSSFNLVVTYHNHAPEPVAGAPVHHDEVHEGFRDTCATARSIIQHGSNWRKWVLCDREPIARWVDGRVALLGDAAHPMMQYFAQGACMAMEDAVALTHLLQHSDDVETAMLRYQTARTLRTARVQLQSRAIGDHIYHPSGVHAALRNEIMQAKSAAEWYDILAWLYGGSGLSGIEMPAAEAVPRRASA